MELPSSLQELIKTHLADYAGLVAEVSAILVIFYGTLEALVRTLRATVGRAAHEGWRKEVWSRLGMWLLLGLQFALAADIVRSAIAPTWNEIGQLAAIAAIRTFLGFFLERDLSELAPRAREGASEARPG
jgi:uncharacterized membrane protein